MLNYRKIRINHIFNTVFVFYLLLLSAILSYVFVFSIVRLGRLSNKENAKNIKNQVSSLVMHDVKIKSNYYSFLFEGVVQNSILMKERYTLALSKIAVSNSNNDIEKIIPLMQNSKGKLFNNFTSEKVGVLALTGKSNSLTLGQKQELGILYDLKDFYCNVEKISPYINYVWVITTSRIVATYPNRVYKKNINDWYRGFFKEQFLKYSKAYSTNKNYWTEAYADIHGNMKLDIITSIKDSKQKYIGVLGVSINLDSILTEILQDVIVSSKLKKNVRKNLSYSFFPGSFSFIIDVNGDLVAFPYKIKNIFALQKQKVKINKLYNLKHSKYKAIRDLAEIMIKDVDGIYKIRLNESKYIVAFSTMKESSWTLGVVIPETDLLDTIRAAERVIKDTTYHALIIVAFITIILLIVLTVINIAFINKILIKPVINLCKDASDMGKGNFDLQVSDSKMYEMSLLANSLNDLGAELKNYMKSLKKEIAGRQEIETEINIALDIQHSILPKVTEDILNRNFYLYAKIFPSEIVSGDFYDFFYLDKEKTKIALIMADVSGHGLPAAFYMSVAKVILKTYCLENHDDPGQALEKINSALCKDVSSGMYVSALIIYYDIRSRKLKYANAAYNEAVVIKNRFVCGLINNHHGMVLGKKTNSVYTTDSFELGINDKIILFTNGLVKALSVNSVKKYEKQFKSFIDLIETNRVLPGHELAEKLEIKLKEKTLNKGVSGASVMMFELTKEENY